MRHSLFVVALILVAGCGTLFTADTKVIPLDSNPVAAEVVIDGVVQGVTPMTLELSNRDSHTIQFRKEGYQSVVCQLNATVSGGIVVLDILGGLVPLIVDAATGNWKRLENESCEMQLSEQ